MAEWNRDTPWRQGHLLGNEAIEALKLRSSVELDQMLVIVASHDCDLVVEGLVRAQGGIGTLLLNQNKSLNLAAIFAIQLTILVYGILQDIGLNYLRFVVCPWSRLNRSV